MFRRASLAIAAVVALLSGTAAQAGTSPAMVVLPFNHDCIAPEPLLFVDGDCDGGGYVYSDGAQMPKAGPVTLSGVTFQFPEHGTRVNNTVVAVGQSVPLPGKKGYAWLHVLAFATDGSDAPSTATVVYTDGSTTKGSLRVNDWTSPARAVLRIPKHGPTEPVQSPDIGFVDLVSIPLDPNKIAKSITLPTTAIPSPTDPSTATTEYAPNIQLFAMTLSSAPAAKPKGAVFT